jgi:hypothetical protein
MASGVGNVDTRESVIPPIFNAGYDANKEISGRKRHIAVDTDGRLLAASTMAKRAP